MTKLLICLFLVWGMAFSFLQVVELGVSTILFTLEQASPAYVTKVSAMSKTTKHIEITAYTCGAESTGKTKHHPDYCLTSSGYRLTEHDAWKVVAADPKHYPPNTKMYIPGIGYVLVKDSGGDIEGPYRLDIFVGKADVELARTWGRQGKEVTIYR